MKIRIMQKTLAAVGLLALTPVFTLSQFNSVAADTQTVVSNFSTPLDLGEPLNSVDTDNGPALSPNGLSLYFSSTRGSGNHDIWVSQRPTVTSAWGAPQNLGSMINTNGIDNQPALSADGLTLFWNSDGRSDSIGQDIYLSTRRDVNNDFGWTTPVHLGPGVNTTADEVSAAYFEDPASDVPILYFASNRSGNPDIYQSKRSRDGVFQPATNVTELNSAGREEGASIRRDGREILFSSDRDSGSRDIWVSTRLSTSLPWSAPVSLTAINSEYDDSHPTHSPDGTVIYFSSGRPGGSGSVDIYTAHRLCTTSAWSSRNDLDHRNVAFRSAFQARRNLGENHDDFSKTFQPPTL